MELQPRNSAKIRQLIDKGVDIPNPLTLDIGEEVSSKQISGSGVRLYPGCRISGERTVIAAGAQLGREAPVTVENCQIGPRVELKGGYFKESAFLTKASMGFGAHVREGCILEEEASGAHCVGLKQTILFPFVTLGSLINFCDCLMSGGTSRKDHSEVGSSYIHFNFTPEGDKTTASLIGDVPRGVMLNQRPIFLGGQGGIVGPIRVGYGNVVVAGTILRRDYTKENKLIIGKTPPGTVMDLSSNTYGGLARILTNNILYLANLAALELWYRHVRQQFFSSQEFAELLYQGVLNTLVLAKQERIKRLKSMIVKIPVSYHKCGCNDKPGEASCEVHDNMKQVYELFNTEVSATIGTPQRESFLEAFCNHRREYGQDYIEVIKGMPPDLSQQGVRWLDAVIDELCCRAAAILPSFHLFRKKISV